MRAFVAVDLEDEGLKEKIGILQRRLLESGADLKLVERQNLHLTLRFLGEVQEALLDRAHEALLHLSLEAFSITLKGMGAFPHPERPSAIWIGVEEGEGKERLTGLAEAVNKALRPLFGREDKPFSPHLTIARVRSPRSREPLAELIREHQGLRIGEYKISSVKIKKSELFPSGPIYTDLFVLRLKEEP